MSPRGTVELANLERIAEHYEKTLAEGKAPSAEAVMKLIAKEVEKEGIYGVEEQAVEDLPWVTRAHCRHVISLTYALQAILGRHCGLCICAMGVRRWTCTYGGLKGLPSSVPVYVLATRDKFFFSRL